MSDRDFAHSREATLRRAVKARKLWLAVHATGTDPAQLADHLEDNGASPVRSVNRFRLAVQKAADLYRHPSPETWAMALRMLAEQAPRAAADHPDDPCEPNEAGVLMELPGWPCPHGRVGYVDTPVARARTAGAMTCGPGVTTDDAREVEAFAQVLRAAQDTSSAAEDWWQ